VIATLLRIKWTYLVAGIILGGIGLLTYLGAHPSKPVEIDGTEASYSEFSKGSSYDHNELKLQGDDHVYTLDKTTFQPALPDEVFKGGKMQIWIDEGTTTVIAITLYDESDQNPTKYTTDVYDHPANETSTTQNAGILIGVVGAILIAIFSLWFALGSRRQGAVGLPGARMNLPAGLTQTPITPTSSPGVSPDGKWYWDGAGWQQVSDDGKWRWDGERWIELGTVYAARGAPPPPASLVTS